MIYFIGMALLAAAPGPDPLAVSEDIPCTMIGELNNSTGAVRAYADFTPTETIPATASVSFLMSGPEGGTATGFKVGTEWPAGETRRRGPFEKLHPQCTATAEWRRLPTIKVIGPQPRPRPLPGQKPLPGPRRVPVQQR